MKSTWAEYNCFQHVTSAFAFMAFHPYIEMDVDAQHFQLLEYFTAILYDKTSDLQHMYEAREELFCRKGKMIERLPQLRMHYCSTQNLICLWFRLPEKGLYQNIAAAEEEEVETLKIVEQLACVKGPQHNLPWQSAVRENGCSGTGLMEKALKMSCLSGWNMVHLWAESTTCSYLEGRGWTLDEDS